VIIERYRCRDNNCSNFTHTCLQDDSKNHRKLIANDITQWVIACEEDPNITVNSAPSFIRGTPTSRKDSSPSINYRKRHGLHSGFQTSQAMQPIHIHNYGTQEHPKMSRYDGYDGYSPYHRSSHSRSHRVGRSSPVDPDPDHRDQVERFMNWLTTILSPEDCEHLPHAKQEVLRQEMDIEGIRTMPINELASLTGCLVGCAQRIQRNVKEFLKEDV